MHAPSLRTTPEKRAKALAGRKTIIFATLVIASFNTIARAENEPNSSVDEGGMTHIRNLDVPFSSFASPEARRAFVKIFSGPKHAPPADADIATRRAYFDQYNSALVERARKAYAVDIQPQVLGGVKAELITPKGGVSSRNRGRVLINLHGGAFLWGEGSGGEIESIPIAAVGRIAVITVAYREGPEHKFPAASEDVASVYKELLKDHKPNAIGIYGCSAGGILTAEAVAWFQKAHLPMPGAVGTFCGSVSGFGGDSVHINFPLTAEPPLPGAESGELTFSPYFSEASPNDPLVLPINSAEMLAKFPPTLLIAGSRDFTVSSLYRAQAALTSAGVETELHVWDGMWHAFFIDPDLPESKQAYDAIVKFFAHHLEHGGATRSVEKR